MWTLSEYGGDPMWIDRLAYIGRKFIPRTEDYQKTSFGNLSIQVREAETSLGYNRWHMSYSDEQRVISTLQDPILNIYVAAKHLSDLKKIDFADIPSSQLTVGQLSNIATRYNRGRNPSLETIKRNNEYGAKIIRFMDVINQAMKQ